MFSRDAFLGHSVYVSVSQYISLYLFNVCVNVYSVF